MATLEKRLDICRAFKDVPIYGLFDYLISSGEDLGLYGMIYSREKNSFIQLEESIALPEGVKPIDELETTRKNTRPRQTYLDKGFKNYSEE
ncbi:MAG: hypothetical protein AABW84_02180 [Nanoarchaeota archaeon]